MSDHFPCLLKYDLFKGKIHAEDTVIYKRKLSDNALLKIQQNLLMHDWTAIQHCDVNSSYEYLITTITYYLDQFAPVKKIILHGDERFRKPWMTVSIKCCNQKSRSLCNKAKHRATKQTMTTISVTDVCYLR